MAGWVADKSWLLIMVLQIDSENSATGLISIKILVRLETKNMGRMQQIIDALIAQLTILLHPK